MLPILLATLHYLLLFGFSIAAPANPTPYRYLQPDGSETPSIWLHGDQFYNWMSDEKGYTIVRDESGWYNYATKTNEGDIISSGIPVGSKNPTKLGIMPGLFHAEHKRPIHGIIQDFNTKIEQRSLFQIPENAICGFNGSKDQPCRLRGIVFLVQFSDHSKRVLPSQQEYDILFNNNGPDSKIASTGSVADVFSENSYQTFVLDSYVTPWIQVGRTEAQTVDGNMGLNKPGTRLTWTEAITKFANTKVVDLKTFDVNKDGQFDCVVILHSGSAAETGGIDCENGKDTNGRIWSHATVSSLYTTFDGLANVNRYYVASALFGVCPPGGNGSKWNIARVAVIAHECAHFLGLPDLYDTLGGQGVGTYDLMANMWGWYGNQWYPPLFGAWSKLKLGWGNVVHVKGEGKHTFQLGPACTSGTILYVDHRMKEGEYFLLEYRFPCGFDKELAHHNDWKRDRSGLAIWHIDESGLQKDVNFQSEGIPGKSKLHYAVALVQGDGAFNMEKELKDGGNKGDSFDLFLDCNDYDCGKSKKIDNNGITKANGSRLSEPSTKGYAGGTQYENGITFEVGAYAAKLSLTITLEGNDPDPNKFPGESKGNAASFIASRNEEIEPDRRPVTNSSPVTKKPKPIRRKTAGPTRKPRTPSK